MVFLSFGRGSGELFGGELLLKLELIFGKGMRTATFQFSESGGSLNRTDVFTELPFLYKSLPKP